MHIVQHALLPHVQHDGELGIAAVDRSRGIEGFEVWVRTLEPGAHTAIQRHAGELAVVALAGAGKLLIHGGPQRFAGPCTLVVPADTPFEIANYGTSALQMIWVFTQAPLAVADGVG